MEVEQSFKFIRKLQKKLRQIERLEQSPQELSNEELFKISSKSKIRQKLQDVLSVIDAANISLGSEDANTSKEDNFDITDDDPSISIYAGISGDNKNVKGHEKTSQVNAQEEVKNCDILITEQNNQDTAHNTELLDPKICKLSYKESVHEHNDVNKAKDLPKFKSSSNNDICDVNTVGLETKTIDLTTTSSTKIQTKKKTKKSSPQSKLRKAWKDKRFCVMELEGHNYTVICLDMWRTWAVSGSKDTSIKLWDFVNGEEICNMGGHTGWVTSIKLLSVSESDNIRKHIECNNPDYNIDISQKSVEHECFVFSGSTDCSLKYWLVPSGICVNSIYNYNPISSMLYHSKSTLILIGSETGRLTVYDIITKALIYKEKIHDESLKTMFNQDNKVFTSSMDGTFKIWELKYAVDKITEQENEPRKAECSLRLLYALETPTKPIYCHTLFGDHLYFGGDTSNIRVFDVPKGTQDSQKLRNHSSNYGFCDTVTTENEILFSSSYNIIKGEGSINLRSLNKECKNAYLATLNHDLLKRILAMAVQFVNGRLYILTGGENLVVFTEILNQVTVSRETIIPRVEQILCKDAIDSDAETDSSDNDADAQSSWFWGRSADLYENTKEEYSSDDSDSDLETEDQKSSFNSLSYWKCCFL